MRPSRAMVSRKAGKLMLAGLFLDICRGLD